MDHWEDARWFWQRWLFPMPEWHKGPGKVASLASRPIRPYEPIDDMIPLAENEVFSILSALLSILFSILSVLLSVLFSILSALSSFSAGADGIGMRDDRFEKKAEKIEKKAEKIEKKDDKIEKKAEKIETKYRELVTDALNNESLHHVFRIPGLNLQTRVRLSGRRKMSADRNPVLALTVVVKMPDNTEQDKAENVMAKSYLETWRYMRSKGYENKIFLNFVRESDTHIWEKPGNKSQWLCEWTSISTTFVETIQGYSDTQPVENPLW
ncbi:hypothetical protein E8E14_011435 [Neopestalotiopsis sp. 37M]|nr:hypothetical protein E8E14_011435 [Neopestalotiopsis sp. 37M]